MELIEIERRMWPGGWSTRPLLRRGDSLVRLLDEDAGKLRDSSITAEVLGQSLADLLQQAARSDWFRPFRHPSLDVEVHRRRGFITCPWAPERDEKCPVGRGGRATANEFLIRHHSSGRALNGFELSAHLIRDHGFFGGPGTPFRIEPLDLALILGIHTQNTTGA